MIVPIRFAQIEKRTWKIGAVPIILLMCLSSCFGQFGEPDKFMEGKVLDKIRGDIELWPIANVASFVRQPVSESERTWIEQKFVAGTSPYYFKYKSEHGFTDGYCLAKNNVVVSSFILEKDRVQPPEVKYTVPSTLQVDVKADPTQPAGYPILLELTVTNRAKVPFKYSISGPGDYLGANLFTAQITDQAKQTREVELENGQYVAGRFHSYDLAPGQTLTVPASADVLSVGSYHIEVGDGKTAVVTVKVGAELEKAKTEEIIRGIRENNPFMGYITTHYNLTPVLAAFSTADILAAVRNGNSFFQKLAFEQKIQPVMKGLEDDLTSTDVG